MKTLKIAIGLASAFAVGYATKWAVDHFTAKKPAATEVPSEEEEEAAK